MRVILQGRERAQGYDTIDLGDRVIHVQKKPPRVTSQPAQPDLVEPQPTPTDPHPAPTDPHPTPTDPQPIPAETKPATAETQPTTVEPSGTPSNPQPTPTNPEPPPAKPEPASTSSPPPSSSSPSTDSDRFHQAVVIGADIPEPGILYQDNPRPDTSLETLLTSVITSYLRMIYSLLEITLRRFRETPPRMNLWNPLHLRFPFVPPPKI
ncbi:unnamed protein product [Darwinula stevensoni]|uniref:Uncharacterized protein n=1 Tax=Darwinula stevensoni TaxID=69355 RepID=A0A7R8X2V0_9CRUS|nr:unnamed protein product [Darwinula stevensoni]CAG0881636.1 unnamed protein product [Darwinula stevensoni]